MAASTTTSAHSGTLHKVAPFGWLNAVFDMLFAAHRAAFLADRLYVQSDADLAAKGLTRDGIGRVVVDELERR